ncbi:MAG: aminotransferase class I/II-fold pyridoxal phosphate-dependent enzyme, partial [Verrucomicrobiota bacterium]|nr:aminotransferase class I/II-fold pyridoxal phosphate-dependent enzyme [Verrucomicrobiota bacterium]
RIIKTRQWLFRELTDLGFNIFPSQTNFIFTRPPKFSAQDWLEKLRALKILVRWFDYPETKDFLRITVGTDSEANALIKAARKIIG